jgi:transposase InsO family protein
MRIVRTPIQAPQANGIAERFVRTVRAECLDWLLILSAGHLEGILTVYIDHYNCHRPHRSLDLTPPNGPPANDDRADPDNLLVVQRDRLGGLVHEHERAA